MKYIISIDEGTTSVRAMLYDVGAKKFVYTSQQEVAQIYPKAGWVEEDASEISQKAERVLSDCIEKADGEVLGIGLTNQRESVVFWDKITGEPVYNCIIWQCRRTEEFCRNIPDEMKRLIKDKTGLQCDAYFSASKIRWGIENVPEVKKLIEEDRLYVGTIDSFIIYKLTGEFVTDYTNASRTMLFNIHDLCWDDELLEYFSIPKKVLPKVCGCDEVYGEYVKGGNRIKVAGLAGDQQAALVGQACLSEGDGKVTYGTGLFMLFNTGKKSINSDTLVSTIGYSIGGEVSYALEGSVFNAGSTIQWLRDGLGFFKKASESEALARSVEDTQGVYLIPAFTGLGAPYWVGGARAMICGITRGADKRHITRAALESIAYSAKDIADVMEKDSGITLNQIRADGGASANGFLMQFQSDVLGIGVELPAELECTALGATFLCMLALGLVKKDEIASLRQHGKEYSPSDDREHYEGLYNNYRKAVRKCIYEEV